MHRIALRVRRDHGFWEGALCACFLVLATTSAQAGWMIGSQSVDSQHIQLQQQPAHSPRALPSIQGGDPNPGIAFPPGSSPYGISYAEWTARWWNWALGQPFGSDPISDPDGSFCDVGQSGPVWNLAGTFGARATRGCTIPAGKAILFPIANVYVNFPCGCPACAVPGLDPNLIESCLASLGADYMDDIDHLEAELDGVPLQQLFDYRTPSGLFTLLPDASFSAIDGCVTGDPQPAVSDGFWVMLMPLSVGEHTLGFTASGTISLTDPNCTFEFPFEVKVAYNLKVIPPIGVEASTWGVVKDLYR
jgi:hypothetical protein